MTTLKHGTSTHSRRSLNTSSPYGLSFRDLPHGRAGKEIRTNRQISNNKGVNYSTRSTLVVVQSRPQSTTVNHTVVDSEMDNSS